MEKALIKNITVTEGNADLVKELIDTKRKLAIAEQERNEALAMFYKSLMVHGHPLCIRPSDLKDITSDDFVSGNNLAGELVISLKVWG